jgi:lipopolysaccharide transport system ATP-binding protein
MSSDIAIRVEDLSKAYMIKHQQNDHVTLAQVALERVRHPLRRSEREQFWAMQDVAFEVNAGEVLGVIGRNGAGKSTLLKLLTRITAPTTGEIDIWGRVGSLLEVGTGFHPELTGRENIYLNGSIIGMKREEIDRQFDAIVDFAGVEKFLDTPVKRYSSGMYVRLAFAVAAHLETEILLIDEVLAVGDQEFQRKCLDKMHQSAVDGRTVLFVSHQLESITTLCNRVLRLDSGRVHSIGETSEIISGYIKDQTRMEVRAPSRVQSGSTWQLGSARNRQRCSRRSRFDRSKPVTCSPTVTDDASAPRSTPAASPSAVGDSSSGHRGYATVTTRSISGSAPPVGWSTRSNRA